MTYYTHSGVFHCDEVTGFAITRLAEVCTSAIRLVSLEDLPTTGLIADIGRIYDPLSLMFDHHQGMLRRENGYPYASAGLLWAEYGHLAVKNVVHPECKYIDQIVNYVDEHFIQGIDAFDSDNDFSVTAKCSGGPVKVKTLSGLISSFNDNDPTDHPQQFRQFNKGVGFIMYLLVSEIEAAERYFEVIESFGEISDVQGEILQLSANVPWKRIVHEMHPNVKFVISPSARPGAPFSMIAVPIEPGSREVKLPIERAPGFDGFIHQGKWIAGGKSVEELKALAQWNIERFYAEA